MEWKHELNRRFAASMKAIGAIVLQRIRVKDGESQACPSVLIKAEDHDRVTIAIDGGFCFEEDINDGQAMLLYTGIYEAF